MARKICAALFYAWSAVALALGGLSLAGMILSRVPAVDSWLLGVSLGLLAAAVVLLILRRPREAAVLALLSGAAAYGSGLHMVSQGLTVRAFLFHHAAALLPLPFAAAVWVLDHRARARERAQREAETDGPSAYGGMLHGHAD